MNTPEPMSDREADEMAEHKEWEKENRMLDREIELPRPIIPRRGWGDLFAVMMAEAMSKSDKQRGI